MAESGRKVAENAIFGPWIYLSHKDRIKIVMWHIYEKVSLRRTHWNSFCPAECVYECKKWLKVAEKWLRMPFLQFFSHLFHSYDTQRDKNCFNVFAEVRPFHRYVTWLFSYNHCVYNKFKPKNDIFSHFSGHFQPFLHSYSHSTGQKLFQSVRRSETFS